MRFGNYLWRGRRLALGTVVVCATMGATASAALAADYTATIAPGSVAAGSSTTFTLTLTDNSASNPLNAVIVTPPQGFAVTGASTKPGSGNATVQNGQVVAKGLALKQNQTAALAITATAPGTCGQSSWTVQAFKSSLNGPLLTPDGQNSSLTTTTCGQTVTCPSGTCTTTVSSPFGSPTPSTSTVQAFLTDGESGTLSESVDVGTAPTCAGYTAHDDNFYTALYTPKTGGQPAKTITYTIFNTGEAGSTIHLCFEAPYRFEQLGDVNFPSTDTGPFVGLLERCDGDNDPCQTETQVPDLGQPSGNDTKFTIMIPAGEPGDPAYHG
jgi:hypothetical protein